MPKQRPGIGLSLVLLLTASVGSAAAQQSEPSKVTVQPGTECGGQCECVEDRPLTPAIKSNIGESAFVNVLCCNA